MQYIPINERNKENIFSINPTGLMSVNVSGFKKMIDEESEKINDDDISTPVYKNVGKDVITVRKINTPRALSGRQTENEFQMYLTFVAFCMLWMLEAKKHDYRIRLILREHAGLVYAVKMMIAKLYGYLYKPTVIEFMPVPKGSLQTMFINSNVKQTNISLFNKVSAALTVGIYKLLLCNEVMPGKILDNKFRGILGTFALVFNDETGAFTENLICYDDSLDWQL